MNCYPEQFIKIKMKPKFAKESSITGSRKVSYLQLPYKGDTIHDLVSSRLKRTIQQTYPAAALKIINRTQRVVPFYGKDKLAVQSRSMCVYNFTCTCGARYIGRTARQLSKRIKEHHPAALQKGTVKCINSSILHHWSITITTLIRMKHLI